MNDKPFSLLSNLVKTPRIEEASADGKLDFASAMTQLGYVSVFDILRTAKPEFVRKLYTLSNANGELAYENARCYATQIVRLYRNQLISSGRSQPQSLRSGVRSLVEIGPSFPNLFKENWDQFCKVGALEAKDSPVAYLTSLYRFARQELEGSTSEGARIPLDLRRPDLKDLLIDQQSTFTPIPMLSIVHDVLGKAIRAYVDTVPADKDKTLYQLIAEKHHPFLFPYDYHHQQAVLGLSGKKPMPGELNYRISLETPAMAPGGNTYGVVQKSSAIALMMMSGLSAEQQKIVLADSLPASDESNDLLSDFFMKKFAVAYADDATNPLNQLNVFIEKTGLGIDQVESLLAIRSHAPYPSPNVLPQGVTATAGSTLSDARKYGASYVNGPSTTEPMDIVINDNGRGTLINTSVDRFDRLQRMIRLQRWMDIPFAELDTLVMAAISAEGGDNPDAVLTSNTLRALGCYRFLHKHYKLPAEEFAALLHHLSPFASDGRMPLFDKVFNSPALFDTPLILDNADFVLSDTGNSNNKTLAQLCAGLQLPATQDSLGPLALDTQNFISTPLKRNLTIISALYRHTRIASMLGLAAKDCWALIDLLGGETWRQHVVTAQLRPVADNGFQPDILDILMQLDWAVTWLRETKRDIDTLRRQLGVDSSDVTITQTLLDQLNQLARDTRTATLNADHLVPLNLPNDSADQPIAWWSLLEPLIDSNGLVIARPLTLIEDLQADLTQTISDQLEGVSFVDEAIKTAAINRLTEFVLSGYHTQHRLVEGLLQSLAELPLNRCEGVLRWAQSSADQLLGELLSATANNDFYLPLEPTAKTVMDTLDRLLRHAEVSQQLGLSAQALRTFLVNPGWLHPALGASLPLSLTSLNLLDRYREWRDKCEEPETLLLTYFTQANSTAQTTDYATLLAPLIGWSASEIEAAALMLSGGAKSMSHVDWLRRMHSTSQQTKLASASLLRTTGLSISSPAGDWQAVGEAVMAASKQ